MIFPSLAPRDNAESFQPRKCTERRSQWYADIRNLQYLRLRPRALDLALLVGGVGIFALVQTRRRRASMVK